MDRDICSDTKVCRLPHGDSSQESFGVFLKEGKQVNALACAPDDVCLKLGLFRFDWERHRTNVKKLQVRIVKAQQEGRYNKVKVLQRLLKHSFSAKVLAVKRVTENKGKKTPGVDAELWQTDKEKCKAVNELYTIGYTTCCSQ